MSNGELPDNEKDISEGEIYIQEFFEEQKIESVYNKKIDFFKYDNKAFRMADFYLPKYDLYVEFLGRWNKNEEERVRYREKMRVYYQNNLPCVYFFPENLGNIKYHFNYRAMKELKDKKKKKHLFNFRKKLVLSQNPWGLFKIFVAFFVIFLVLLTPNIKPQYNMLLIILSSIGILVEGGSLYYEYRKLVKKKFHKERNQYD